MKTKTFISYATLSPGTVVQGVLNARTYNRHLRVDVLDLTTSDGRRVCLPCCPCMETVLEHVSPGALLRVQYIGMGLWQRSTGAPRRPSHLASVVVLATSREVV